MVLLPAKQVSEPSPKLIIAANQSLDCTNLHRVDARYTTDQRRTEEEKKQVRSKHFVNVTKASSDVTEATQETAASSVASHFSTTRGTR